MNTCDHDHDPIAYNGRDCPLCDALGAITQAQEELKEAQKRIEDLEEEARESEE